MDNANYVVGQSLAYDVYYLLIFPFRAHASLPTCSSYWLKAYLYYCLSGPIILVLVDNLIYISFDYCPLGYASLSCIWVQTAFLQKGVVGSNFGERAF